MTEELLWDSIKNLHTNFIDAQKQSIKQYDLSIISTIHHQQYFRQTASVDHSLRLSESIHFHQEVGAGGVSEHTIAGTGMQSIHKHLKHCLLDFTNCHWKENFHIMLIRMLNWPSKISILK